MSKFRPPRPSRLSKTDPARLPGHAPRRPFLEWVGRSPFRVRAYLVALVPFLAVGLALTAVVQLVGALGWVAATVLVKTWNSVVVYAKAFRAGRLALG